MKQLNLEKIIGPKSRVFFVYPHPDDEVPFSGALAQRIGKITDHVNLLCLTRGEATTLRFVPGDIASIRKNELMRAAGILGFKKVVLKDFPDSKLRNCKKQIVEYLGKALKGADLIVTYEPGGVSGHYDHIAATEAVRALPGKKVLYSTVGKSYSGSGRPSTLPNFYIKITPVERRKKIKALSMHRSQFGKASRDSLKRWQDLDLLEKEFFFLE